MALLVDAANTWMELCKYQYVIELGYKNQQISLTLGFDPIEFPHLVGMHYARDVDFKLRRSEYAGERLLDAVLSGKMDAELIEKSISWERIEGRLLALSHLKNTLESKFKITRFNPNKVDTATSIAAEYVIKNEITNDSYFVFLQKGERNYFCKSAFRAEHTDYTKNQTNLTILEITRSGPDGTALIFRHPNYKDKNAIEGK